MALFWICLLASLGLSLANDACPTKEELSPCTCDGEGLNCMAARSLAELKKAFQAKFKYGGVRSIWIQATPLTDLPADTFGDVKSQQFYIEVNELTTVDPAVFRASKNSMHTLSLFGNKIKDFDYSGLKIYEKLGLLNLGRNEIESIPDNAFDSSSLVSLVLSQNKITHIGKNAFSKLPRLTGLVLTLNPITTLGPLSFAIPVHAPQLQINIAGNQISDISETAFEGTDPYAVYLSQNRLTSLPQNVFASLVTNVANKNGFLEVSGNPFDCRGCDYSWLVLNKQILYPKLLGFTCPDRRNLLDLTKENIGCRS